MKWLFLSLLVISSFICKSSPKAIFIIEDYVVSSYDREVVNILKEAGFQVDTLFNNFTLQDVLNKSKNVDLFIYKGHGNAHGQISLNKKVENISVLKFESSPLVILQNTCGSAGMIAGDDIMVSSQEAVQRVRNFCNPLFNSGASSYYATNEVSIENLLRSLLNGVSIGDWINSKYNNNVSAVDLELNSSKQMILHTNQPIVDSYTRRGVNWVEVVSISVSQVNYISAFVGNLNYKIFSK